MWSAPSAQIVIFSEGSENCVVETAPFKGLRPIELFPTEEWNKLPVGKCGPLTVKYRDQFLELNHHFHPSFRQNHLNIDWRKTERSVPGVYWVRCPAWRYLISLSLVSSHSSPALRGHCKVFPGVFQLTEHDDLLSGWCYCGKGHASNQSRVILFHHCPSGWWISSSGSVLYLMQSSTAPTSIFSS